MEESTIIILTFIKILKERNITFSIVAWEALSQLEKDLSNLKDEQDLAVANIIINWCDQYPEIKPAMRDTRADIVEDEEQWKDDDDRRNEGQIITNKFLLQKTIQAAIEQSSPHSEPFKTITNE